MVTAKQVGSWLHLCEIKETDGGWMGIVLWPLFHYLIWNDATDGRLERKQWEAYAMVNRKYAELVCQHYREGDISKWEKRGYGGCHGNGELTMILVWVHDYHLLLVPGMVREKLPKARIGLFIHAPFPSSEIFRCLPSEFFKMMIVYTYL